MGFGIGIIAQIAVAGEKKALQHCAPAEKRSVINMIRLLLSVSNWPIIMIRPGGLLLVVQSPTYLLSQFQFYG
jgi:hypothetical protein